MTTQETLATVERALDKNLPIKRADVRSLVITCKTLLGIVSNLQNKIASLEALQKPDEESEVDHVNRNAMV